MTINHRGSIHRLATAAALTGGAAAIATGMALAGAGTAAADNQQNVVTQTGSLFTPSAAAAPASDPGTNFLSQFGTALTNAISQTGTAISNGQTQVGTAGTNAISQTGTAISNGQTQVGTAGNNALSQTGAAGYGVLNGIGNLFNRG